MTSLDTLSRTGAELSSAQLDDVDGGLILAAVAVVGFAAGYGVGWLIDNAF